MRQFIMNLIHNLAGGNPDGRQAGLRRITLIAACLWLAGIVTSMAFIIQYSSAPGSTGATPVRWPAGSQIAPDASRPTLIMFVHPRCPCTRASIGELDRLVADCEGRFNAQVWFIKPAGTQKDWSDTDLWQQAAAIPGVTVHCDNEGVEARRFQAETSGQTVLYSQDGRLLFHGGITLSRGHAGDNPGRSALEALLTQSATNQAETPVFGCSLFEASTNQNRSGGVSCKQ